MITSQISACKKTSLIWKELSRTGSDSKPEAILESLGRNPSYSNDCPCCDFVGQKVIYDVDCEVCPMIDFWPTESVEPYFRCEGGEARDGLYLKWIYANNSKKRKELANKIYFLAEDALEYWQSMKEMNNIS